MSFLGQLIRHGQNLLIYPSAFEPWPRDIRKPEGHDVSWTNLELLTSDGITLHCYLFSQDLESITRNSGGCGLARIEKLGTIIMFHGNAMDYGDCVDEAAYYYKLHYNVLILSYRGYGNSKGYPSEKGLRKDAQAALDFVLSDPRLSQKPIILIGRSLGGAVAIDLASRNPLKTQGLIIENTFISIPDIARELPFVRYFAFLCHQKWNSASKIPFIPASVPILMLSGAKDTVVPQEHMLKLHDIASTRGKTREIEGAETPTPTHVLIKSFADGTHTDTLNQPGYRMTVERFLSDICGKRNAH